MFARISDSQSFKDFLSKICIKRTINKNIWADAIKPGDYLEVYFEEPKRIYYGQAVFIEEEASDPWIVLKNYYVRKPREKLADHQKNSQHFAMFNTSKISRIKIVRPEPQKSTEC